TYFATLWELNTQDDNVTLIAAGTNRDIIGGLGSIVANSATLSATRAIGAGADLATNVSLLRASAGTNIDIFEVNGVQLGDSISGVTSAGGNISITAGGAITDR